MKKSLIRAFLFSLIAFLILNLIFFVVGFSINGFLYTTFDTIAEHPIWIIRYLTDPFRNFLWNLVIDLSSGMGIGWKIWNIGKILSLLFASIIAGISGGSILRSAGGWILTSILSIGLLISMFLIDSWTLGALCGLCTLNETMVPVIISGIVNLVIFGCVALIVALFAGRSNS